MGTFVIHPHTGVGMAMSRSFDGISDFASDNWLVTPKITVPEASIVTLTCWVHSQGTSFADHYEVLVSRTGTDTGTHLEHWYR